MYTKESSVQAFETLQSRIVTIHRERSSQRLHKVVVVKSAIGARSHAAVFAEKVQLLVRRNDQVLASGALHKKRKNKPINTSTFLVINNKTKYKRTLILSI